MILEETLCFPVDHPALAGHFPGNPIVPGAVLLDHACSLAFRQGGWQVTGVRKARFKSSLPADTDCKLRLTPRSDNTLDLICKTGEQIILSAILEINGSLEQRDA